jgi:hypothetical protein
MTKFFTLLTFLLIASTGNSQDYFETKMKSVQSMSASGMVHDGIAQFDFQSLASKTLLIPKYDPNSLYPKLIFGNQYAGLKTVEEKRAFYKSLWTTGMDSSSFSECKYAFDDVGFESYSAEERKNLLWLSYYPMMGHYYSMIWYVNEEGEPLPCTMTLINGIDLAVPKDLRLMCDFMQQSLSSFGDNMLVEPGEVSSTPADTLDTKAELVFTPARESNDELRPRTSSNPAANYVSEGQLSTLLIPIALQDKSLDKQMNLWKYSAFEYVPKATIQEKIEANDPKYCYVRTFEPVSNYPGIAAMSILNCRDHRIMYTSMIPQTNCDLMGKVMNWMRRAITNQLKAVDWKSTISYINFDFTSDSLPHDLARSKITYVNLTKTQSIVPGIINSSFGKKMKKYPFEYEIVDDPADIKNAQYRVYLKGVMKTISVKTYTDAGYPTTKRVTKELYYLYLEHTKTGECYKFQAEPNFYLWTFKEFVIAAKALEK